MTEDVLRGTLFAGGGELGAAMAGRNWTETPVGPPETWPASLRNSVRILLTSRFSMWAAWGPELTYFYNDAYRRDTLQAKHPWALGRPIYEVWAEIWHDIGPRIRSVLETGVATWDEDLLLFLERSGYPEETYHTFSYSPLADDDARTVGMLCVVTETTERVVGERRMATLRDLAAALAPARTRQEVLDAAREQLLRNLADLPFAAVYLYDADGTARVRTTAGIDPEQGVLPAVIAADDPRRAALAELPAGSGVLVEGLAARFPELPSGDWERSPDRAVVVPLTSSGQGPTDSAGFLVVGLNPHRPYDEGYRGFLDLVAHQLSAALLNADSYEAERERAEALAELDRAKTDFFSNVSHEFRTPLTLIMGPIAELRAAEDLSAPRVREELEVIERNALRLGKLVNTLLDFSRLQAGRIDARFEPVDLAAVTAELAGVFRSAVTRAGLTYDVDCAPLPEPVHVDRDMWEKVVLNLLSNALKYTFEGGITLRLRPGPQDAVLTVTDTGTGIPAAELPRLFERFSRVAGARSRSGEGSGIGLAMVRELVGLHGGTVTAASTPDVGTTFTVTIPLGTAHLPEDRLAPPTPDVVPAVSPAATPFVTEALRWLPAGDPADPAPADGAGPPAAADEATGRVLVADDNADMRDYLLRLLTPRYAVTAVADGAAALDAARAVPPDLVVSDVMMPGMDGMTLVAELRADARTSRVPVLLLSARAGEEAAVEGLAAGADDYLVKPFAAQELLARVGAHVHLGRARREAEERFTAIADLAPALIWVSDREGRRLLVNAGWTGFTGREAGAELGDGWREGVHPDDRERYRQVVEDAVAADRGWEVEFRLRRADGAHAWVLERAVPIGAGLGAAGHVGTCTDISVRHREAERLALLAEAGAVLDRERTVDGQLGALARLLVDRRVADFCTVRQVEPGSGLRMSAVAGLDAGAEARLAALDPTTGIGDEALATGRTVRSARLPWAAGQAGALAAVGSAMAVPLSVGNRVVAVLALARRQDSLPYDDDDRALVEELGARAALAVDNVLLLAEERATARRLAVLQRITAELSAATTPEEVAEVAERTLTEFTATAGRVAVYELDTAQRSLTALAMSGGGPGDPAEWRAWGSIPLTSPTALAAAVTSGRPRWVEEPDERIAERPGLSRGQADSIATAALGAIAALPLAVGGRVLGVLGMVFAGPHRFPDTERGLLLAVAEQIALALDRARLYRAELDIATTLQRSLLPAALPRLADLALAAEYLPGAVGSSAGGDWYDVVELDDDRVAIAVGDVVGQGPAAAAVMGQLRSALSAALLQGCPPAAALELLDRFAARLPGALASSAACLVVERATGRVRWARAGHPPPLLVTGEGVTVLDGTTGSGPVLGVPERAPYTEGSRTVVPGTTLLLYTDGLVERRGESLDVGLARIAEAARRHAGVDPERLVQQLLADVLADSDRPDDVAVIAARVVPPPLHERLPADPARLARVRRAVTAWTGAAGLPADAVDDLQLALGEALANAVEHAHPGPAHEGTCEYSLEREPDGSVAVRVRDDGTWRPAPADRGFRGRGIELIGALATGVEIGPAAGGGTEVRFRVAPPPAGAGPAARSAAPVPGPAGEAALVVHPGGGAPLLEFSGELDIAAVTRLRPRVLAAVARPGPGPETVLDLRSVGYLASAGVGLLLEAVAAVRAAGGRARVDAPPGSPPERVLRLSGLSGELIGHGG